MRQSRERAEEKSVGLLLIRDIAGAQAGEGSGISLRLKGAQPRGGAYQNNGCRKKRRSAEMLTGGRGGEKVSLSAR